MLVFVAGAAAQLRFGVADESGVFASDGGAAFFSQLRDLGMSDDRFTIKWDAAQPETIPDEAFLDRAVPVAAAHGIRVVFAVYPLKPTAISASPDASAQFVSFLQLVARTYSPSVVIVGDEPNQPRFWQPQFDATGKPVAGAAYEAFLAQAYDALKAVNPAIDVVAAGPSSRGNDNPNAKNNRSTSPVRFIRDLGLAYRQSGRTKPIMDQLGFHPYPQQNTDPATKDYQWPKIGLANLPRLKQAVWDAFHGTAQPTFAESGTGGGLTLMMDEVGWQVGVNSTLYSGKETVPTISGQTQAQTYTDLIRVAACDPSATDLLLFQLVDETDLDRFQSGLIRADGSQRPAYQAVKQAIAETGGRCASPPATWQHASAVDNAHTFDCAPGAHTPEQTYWSVIVRADEDTTYRAGIFKLPSGKVTPSAGALAATLGRQAETSVLAVDGTTQAYIARLVRFPARKLAAGRYVCAARLSSVMNPERTSTLISAPFTVGKGADASGQVLGASTSSQCGAVQLSGSAWLGGRGVDVHSNSPYQGTGRDCSSARSYVKGILAGEEWQCPEFVNRLYLTRGWIKATWYGNGDEMYDKAPKDLAKQAQGSINYLAPGDVVSIRDFSGGQRVAGGHVAVVNTVVKGTDGVTTAQLVSQNSSSVTRTATLKGGKVTIPSSGSWSYYVVGVVHAPGTGFQPPPAGSIVAASDGASYVYYGGKRLQWIPTPNTYWCEVDKGRPVYKVSVDDVKQLGTGQPWQPKCLSLKRVINHIVREKNGVASYTVTADGTSHGAWHWIEKPETYNCLIKTMPKIDAEWAEINSLRGSHGENERGNAEQATPCGGSQPVPKPPPPPSAGPIFTVMNTSETLPDGVWFRNSPHTSDTDRVTGHGVYKNERVQLHCYAFGDSVGRYNDKLWYRVTNVTRPTINGRPNTGFLNAHYINDGKLANQVDAGVPAC